MKAGYGEGSQRCVEAAEGSSQLLVCRSAPVAASRSRSVQTSASTSTLQSFVDAPPGGKRKVRYAYQVLQTVNEESKQLLQTGDPTENASGCRDLDTPQLGTPAGPTALAGRKRSATTLALGSGRSAPTPRMLASKVDISPTHFDEPVSDDIIPAFGLSQQHSRSPSPQQYPPSSMTIDPVAPVAPNRLEESQQIPTPISSESSRRTPFSHNPLLRKPVDVHTSPPQRL